MKMSKEQQDMVSLVRANARRNMIHTVVRSDVDPTGFEICWGEWAIFSQVRREDVRLLTTLVALRVQTLLQKNKLAVALASLH